jgi:hypothetical protein
LNIAAQEHVDMEMIRMFLTDIAARDDEEQNIEQLPETFEDLADNPVYINQAGYEELSRIIWLTDFQIKSLLDRIRKSGPVLSYYEIAYLHGFTPELAQTLIPFTSLDVKQETKIVPQRVFRYGKNRILTGMQTVLQEQEGYIRPDSVENKYTGNPVKTYLRYAFSYSGQVYFGLTAEKDAGEAFFRGTNPYGFDFYSAHLQISTDGILKTVTAGDFRADFAQGLVLWSGFNYGKSAMILNSMRYNPGLRKYASTDENRFMRGVGVTLRLKPADFSVFYSRKKIDATVSSMDDDGKAIVVSSFPSGGYHRTPNEIAQKDAVTERIVGTNMSVTRTNWHIGATAVYYGYDAGLAPADYIYNRFAFRGKSNSNYSVDFRLRLGDALFYGEQAFSQNGAMAMIYGMQALIGDHLNASILYRNYAKNYHALYGRALGESSGNSNEEGFFMGLNWNPGGRWQFSSYYDVFRFPWLRYRTDAPSFGRDALLRADYTPSRDTKIYIQARYGEKEENVSETAVSSVTPVRTKSAKMTFSHQIVEGCGIGNHLEIKNYRKESAKSNGYFLSQDFYTTVMTFKRFPLRATLRYAFFDTDNYDSRIYSYENDMLYAFSIPGFYGRGTRFYFLLRYSLGKHFDLRFKYATTHYIDRTAVGSGLNVVQGDRLSEIKLQLSCKF